MTTLYDLSDRCAELLRALEAIDAMDMPEDDRKAAHDALEAEYWGAEGDLATKAEGYVRIARELENRAFVRKEETERLAKLAQSDSNQAKRLKDRLRDRLASLEYTTKRPLETPLYKLNVAAVGGNRSVVIADPDATRAAVPELFERIVTEKWVAYEAIIRQRMEEWEAREALRQLALEDGEEYIPTPAPVPGVTLKPRGTRLVIR